LITDVRMPGMDGFALMARALEIDPNLPVIMITGHGDIAMALRAVRCGAYDFMEKPFPAEILVDTVRRALERRTLIMENRRLKEELAASSDNVVIGVVGNTRAMELNNTDATEIYYPPTAAEFPEMSVLVRVAGDPNTIAPAIKAIVGSIDTQLFPTITPLTAGFRKSVSQVEQIATMISLLGGIAIFLAVLGLLGLVSYAVSQRTREIAIRLALGANRIEIFTSIVRRFVWPVLLGLVAGVAITAGLSQILRRVLYGISGLDPISYAGAMTILVAILIAAALPPIRRVLRLDLARTLQSE